MADVVLTDAEMGVGVLVADALNRLGIEIARSGAPAPAGQSAAAEVWLERLEEARTGGLVVNHCRLRSGGLSRRSLEMAESVLAAASRCETLHRVVVVSSGQLYGAGPDQPTFVAEDYAPTSRPGPSAIDFADLEAAAARFASARPDVSLTVLRVAETVGTAPHGLLSDHLLQSGGFVTTRFGYDPQVQFVTAHSVAAAVVHALTGDTAGVFNFAPTDALPLSAAIRLVGCSRVPILRSLSLAGGILRRMEPWSHELARLLTYGRALDPQRALDAGFPEPSPAAAAVAAAVY